jgi:hypothetical protein
MWLGEGDPEVFQELGHRNAGGTVQVEDPDGQDPFSDHDVVVVTV